MTVPGYSVFGYFADRSDAEAAQERLVAAGFEKARLGAAPGPFTDGSLLHGAAGPVGGGASAAGDAAPPMRGPSPDSASFALDNATGLDFVEAGASGIAGYGLEGSILLAANPRAGFSAEDFRVRARPWLVEAVTDGSDAQVERAVQILKHYGADFWMQA